jgi:hypothetical protein
VFFSVLRSLLVAGEHLANKVISLGLDSDFRNRVNFVEIKGVIKILRKWLAEYIGTATLVCVVVGSGIMGTNLSKDTAVALLVNTFSTIFALALLILIIAPISGAHFNPAVSLVQVFDVK